MNTEPDLSRIDGSHGAMSCREVLMCDIADAAYVGNYAHLRTLESADNAMAKGHSKIQRLLQHVSSLGSHRNTLIPVSRLSDDLLVEIFSYITRRANKGSRPHWLAFSQVCGRWRTAALAAAGLWTYPDLTNLGLTQMMLQRSQSAPLHIIVNDSFPASASALFRTHPVEEFRYAAVSTHIAVGDWVEVSEFLSRELSDLKYLAIGGGIPLGVTRILNLWNLYAPNIQSLQFDNLCPSTWDAFGMENLTTFEVVTLDMASHTYQPPCVLDLLARMSRLRKLKLYTVMKNGVLRPPIAENSALIGLPCLQEIDLVDDGLFLENLFTHLDTPCLVNIAVHGRTSDYLSDEQILEVMIRVVQRVVENSQWTRRVPVEQLELSLQENDVVRFAARTSTAETLLAVEVGINLENCPDADLNGYWQSFLSIIPLNEVTSLNVRNVEARPSTFNYWVPISILPKLRTIQFWDRWVAKEVWERAVEKLINALASTTNEGDQNSGESTSRPFPSLQLIYIVDANMFRPLSDSQSLGFSLVPNLVEAVTSRHADGVPLSVRLTACRFGPQDDLQGLPELIHVEKPTIFSDFMSWDREDEEDETGEDDEDEDDEDEDDEDEDEDDEDEDEDDDDEEDD